MKKIVFPAIIASLALIGAANAQIVTVIPGPVAFATKSGNTNVVGTTSGALTNGHCVSIDGSGNLVDAGGACSTGGGGGTVSSGTINQLGVYASTGTVISGLATANSGVLVTSGSGVPSISTTLPNGLALGTPGSVTLTNATGLPIGGITGLGTGIGTWLATPSSANLASAVTDETGSGALAFATSPTLVTPTLGVASATTINKVTVTAPATNAILTIADGKTLTDTSAVGANLLLGATGGGFSAYAGVTCTNQFLRVLSAAGAGTCASVAIASDVSGLGTGIATWLGTPTSANLRAGITDETGSGVAYFQNGDLGTPSAGVLTNATGLPIAGITGLGSGVGTWLATPSCANFFTAVTGETGSGACVGATSPTLVTPVLGVATGTSLALGGGSIGSDALEITGTSTFNGASNILAQLNVQNGTISPSGGILIGADSAATTRTDATNKFGAIIGYPYTNAQNSVELFAYNSTTSANNALFCGGNSTVQACTDIKFYTAAATNTAGSSAINVLHLDINQHIGVGGNTPAAGSCGTTPGTPVGNDNAFTIVAGATTGSCTVNFAKSYGTAPVCIAQDRSTVQALRYAISTSAITIIATAALGGDTLAVICQGN